MEIGWVDAIEAKASLKVNIWKKISKVKKELLLLIKTSKRAPVNSLLSKSISRKLTGRKFQHKI